MFNQCLILNVCGIDKTLNASVILYLDYVYSECFNKVNTCMWSLNLLHTLNNLSFVVLSHLVNLLVLHISVYYQI